jgi:hypothetical protein
MRFVCLDLCVKCHPNGAQHGPVLSPAKLAQGECEFSVRQPLLNTALLNSALLILPHSSIYWLGGMVSL